MNRCARIAVMSLLAVSAGLAGARERGPGPGPGPGMQGRMVLDSRYHHDHYYPAPGFVSPSLPRGSVSIGFGADSYFFHGGVWYRPYGPRYRVILPPVGIIVPVLPASYVSLRIGGAPYYYANGVYYANVVGGYRVVEAPADAAEAQPAAPPAPPRPDPIIYPRSGQSAAQTEADRQECNRWATTQPASMNDASVFNRAVEACMDGRGYSMR